MRSGVSKLRRLITLLPALPCLGIPALATQGHAATSGSADSHKPRRAPGFRLPLWSPTGPVGRDISLDQLVDRWVYLDFWASWCAPCKQSFPWMDDLFQVGKGRGLMVLAIGLDRTAGNLERFLQQQKPSFPVAWDVSMGSPKAYDVLAMPSSYLISPAAEIVSTHRGFRPADADARKQELLGHL